MFDVVEQTRATLHVTPGTVFHYVLQYGEAAAACSPCVCRRRVKASRERKCVCKKRVLIFVSAVCLAVCFCMTFYLVVCPFSSPSHTPIPPAHFPTLFLSLSLFFPSSVTHSLSLKTKQNKKKERKYAKVNRVSLENKHGNKLIPRHRVQTKALTATRVSRSLLFMCAHCKVSGPFNKRPRSILSNFCDFSLGT